MCSGESIAMGIWQYDGKTLTYSKYPVKGCFVMPKN